MALREIRRSVWDYFKRVTVLNPFSQDQKFTELLIRKPVPENKNLCAVHAKRVTTMPRGIQRAYRIRCKRAWIGSNRILPSL